MKKYQLVKIQRSNFYWWLLYKITIVGFNTYISALLWKILTGHWDYKIESIEINIDE